MTDLSDEKILDLAREHLCGGNKKAFAVILDSDPDYAAIGIREGERWKYDREIDLVQVMAFARAVARAAVRQQGRNPND